MLIDTHCHLDFPELAGNLDDIFARMRINGVDRALCVSVNLEDFPKVLALAQTHEHLYASVGVHPDYPDTTEPSVEDLVRLAQHPKIVAIGETGLDYYRLSGDLEWQRTRFRTHIRAAKQCRKPLIIHTRSAAADTIRVMQEEGASEAGGVMHFKNAKALKQVAQKVPLDRLLIETDSPYLAPVPFRGKTNDPSLVKHVAEEIARLRDCSFDLIAQKTTENFYKLIK